MLQSGKTSSSRCVNVSLSPTVGHQVFLSHTSLFDQVTKISYIYGGCVISSARPVDDRDDLAESALAELITSLPSIPTHRQRAHTFPYVTRICDFAFDIYSSLSD